MGKAIPVFFSTDSNYVPHLCATIASVARNCSHALDFKILSDTLPQVAKQNIVKSAQPHTVEFFEINPSDFATFDVKLEHLSLAACYRYIIPKLCPDIDKAIYLDCDLIVLADLAELFNQNIDSLYAAVADDYVRKEHIASLGLGRYFNSGVLLLNLAKIRQDNLMEKFFRYSEELSGKSKYLDQDVLNLAFAEKVLWLHPKWNASAPIFRKIPKSAPSEELVLEACQDPAIVHFTGPDKPWKIPRSVVAHPFSLAYFYYLKQTPYADLVKVFNKEFRPTKTLINYFKRHLFFFTRAHFQSMRKLYRKNLERFK